MESYTDYEYYVHEYAGKEIPEESFDHYSKKASAYIRYLTEGKADQSSLDAVRDATCAACDVYYRCDQAGKRSDGSVSGKVVSSENIDGYSISYAVEGTSGETYEETVDRKAYKAVYPYLAFTGLLNRRVSNANKYRCDTL